MKKYPLFISLICLETIALCAGLSPEEKIKAAVKNPEAFLADPDNEVGTPPECSPYLIAQMQRAWLEAGGISPSKADPVREAAFFVNFRPVNGRLYYGIREVPVNRDSSISSKALPSDRAFFHTHPASGHLSAMDIKTSNDTHIPIYAIARDGLFFYEPPASPKSGSTPTAGGEVQITPDMRWTQSCDHRSKKMGLTKPPNWIATQRPIEGASQDSGTSSEGL